MDLDPHKKNTLLCPHIDLDILVSILKKLVYNNFIKRIIKENILINQIFFSEKISVHISTMNDHVGWLSLQGKCECVYIYASPLTRMPVTHTCACYNYNGLVPLWRAERRRRRWFETNSTTLNVWTSSSYHLYEDWETGNYILYILTIRANVYLIFFSFQVNSRFAFVKYHLGNICFFLIYCAIDVRRQQEMIAIQFTMDNLRR